MAAVSLANNTKRLDEKLQHQSHQDPQETELLRLTEAVAAETDGWTTQPSNVPAMCLQWPTLKSGR